jgi:hypothetical protein
MEIRHKLYPYPVLSYFSDDYVDSCFTVAIVPKRDGYNIRIDFIAELINDGLVQLLSEEKVKIVYHLECAQTGFRTALTTNTWEYSYVISNKQVVGRLQVCPFIIAVTDLPEYVNEKFHDDYRGFKFSIEAGCVMAVNGQVNIDIEKDISDLSNTPSVFSIIKNDDVTVLGMVVEMNYKKLVIKIPEQDFYNFRSVKDEVIIQSVLNSLVIIPALTYVLEEVVKLDANGKYELSSYAWYRAVKKALSTRFNCDIDSDRFSECNMLVLAQKLIDTPLTLALHTLSSGYGNTNEEEEE